MKSVFILFFKLLNVYKKKRLKILIYEIFFSLKYFKTGNLIKFRNNSIMTDTIPCPYYFIHKISQFINKKKITSVIDLGSGYGRITNFLNDSTDATIHGYEIDKEVFDDYGFDGYIKSVFHMNKLHKLLQEKNIIKYGKWRLLELF